MTPEEILLAVRSEMAFRAFGRLDIADAIRSAYPDLFLIFDAHVQTRCICAACQEAHNGSV